MPKDSPQPDVSAHAARDPQGFALANCIRALSIDAVETAKSGHPGAPMGMADAAVALFRDHVKFDASAPDWPDRDRVVLSNGHASMLLYALRHLTGFEDMTPEQVRNFRQLGSITAGHPEYGHAKGVETTTGPLGQGGTNAADVSGEGELGVLGSLETGTRDHEDGHGATDQLSQDQLLTDPDEAARFVADTGIDALAVAMGTSHGAYTFTRKPDDEVLAMAVIEPIHTRLPDPHLVMHGASSVPEELRQEVNAHGGDIPPTWGVPLREIRRGIRHGVRKVTIDTDLRLAATAAIRRSLMADPAEFDPRKYFKPAMASMEAQCIEKFEAFGTAGQADHIRVPRLPEKAAHY